MIMKSDKDDPNIEGELHINNARIKRISIKNEELKLSGIELISQGTSIKFYSPDKEIIDNWFQNLIHFCVQMNIRKDYEISDKVLGSGSFAKVKLCSRISDGKEFALKMIQKD